MWYNDFANGIEPYEYLLLVRSMVARPGKSPTHEKVRYREHIHKGNMAGSH